VSDSLVDLGNTLRELRTKNGLTQEEFAQAAGIGYKFYQQIETARKKQIWLSTIERLAAPYHLQDWELLSPEALEKSSTVKKVPSSRVHRK